MRITKKKLQKWEEIKDDIEDKDFFRNLEEVDYETYEVRVPTQIVEFLETFSINIQKWVEDTIIEQFGADLDCFFNDPRIFADNLLMKLKSIPHLTERINFLVKQY